MTDDLILNGASESRTRSNRRYTRREFAKFSSGITAASLTGVAGCLGDGSRTPDSITLGTLNVFPMMQWFVIQQQGWYESKLDIDVNVETFGGGPGVIQAFASGDIDFAYVGISPGAIAIAKGVSSKVVAANVLEPNVMVGNKVFRELWEKYGKEAFQKFREQEGRKPSFATLPAGSTPDVFLRFWLEEQLGLNPSNVADIKRMSASALRSTLSTGKVDAGSVIEPIRTVLRRETDEMRAFRYAGEIMPGQPGAVLQPSQTLIDDNPELVRSLVDIHIQATDFIHDDRERAAEMASESVGQDVLPPTVAKEAIKSKASTFISNPHRIVDKTLVYNNYHRKIGKVNENLSESDIFDHRFYDELA